MNSSRILRASSRVRLASILAIGIAMATHEAFAQSISDADRKAARDLYTQGVTLQQSGKSAEALDAFQRSFQVFPAPTTALHVAQCQAALGHLVEAEEDYRALAAAKVPDQSPPAFYQAQEQARVELGQIAGRAPTVRITTSPDHINGISVTIDGQAMNPALLGAARAVNPGTHKVVANAPGFLTAEQSITLQEKDTRDVQLVLRPGAGPVQPAYGNQSSGHSNGVQPAYGGNATWSQQQQPVYGGEPHMHRRSGALFGVGIALVVVGSITLLAGAIGIADSSTSSGESGGVAATFIGAAALGGGIAMVVIGGKHVPVRPDALKWVPTKIGVNHNGFTLGWKF